MNHTSQLGVDEGPNTRGEDTPVAAMTKREVVRENVCGLSGVVVSACAFRQETPRRGITSPTFRGGLPSLV